MGQAARQWRALRFCEAFHDEVAQNKTIRAGDLLKVEEAYPSSNDNGVVRFNVTVESMRTGQTIELYLAGFEFDPDWTNLADLTLCLSDLLGLSEQRVVELLKKVRLG